MAQLPIPTTWLAFGMILLDLSREGLRRQYAPAPGANSPPARRYARRASAASVIRRTAHKTSPCRGLSAPQPAPLLARAVGQAPRKAYFHKNRRGRFRRRYKVSPIL